MFIPIDFHIPNNFHRSTLGWYVLDLNGLFLKRNKWGNAKSIVLCRLGAVCAAGRHGSKQFALCTFYSWSRTISGQYMFELSIIYFISMKLNRREAKPTDDLVSYK